MNDHLPRHEAALIACKKNCCPHEVFGVRRSFETLPGQTQTFEGTDRQGFVLVNLRRPENGLKDLKYVERWITWLHIMVLSHIAG